MLMALLRRAKTTIILVKEVISTKIAGANDKTVMTIKIVSVVLNWAFVGVPPRLMVTFGIRGVPVPAANVNVVNAPVKKRVKKNDFPFTSFYHNTFRLFSGGSRRIFCFLQSSFDQSYEHL